MRKGKLTITFLGTGTSMGVPMIACGCEVCESEDRRDKRLRSSIYVETDDVCWVVDTGAEFRIQALRAGIKQIDAVLYTHAHADHIMGFDDLRRFSPNDHAGLPIYASRETMDDLARVFRYAFSGEARFPSYIHPAPHLIDGNFFLGATEICPIPVTHGRAHVLGFLFRQSGRALAAYISDCKSVLPQGMEVLQGVETLILGTPCRRTHPTHMNIEEGLALAGLLSPKQVYFTHLSHDFGHAATQASLPSGAYLAYDGLRLAF
jgi:phosphoribosyl 1,2-cyclic phosphate phosphodiesterase